MTTEDYFDNIPEDHRLTIMALRETILNEYPGIEETMDYKMPSYRLEGEQLFAMASEKQYIALYIFPYRKLDAFRESLKEFDLGKSCIRFKSLEEKQLNKLQAIIAVLGPV